MQTTYHGTNNKIEQIKSGGTFGGIFGAPEIRSAQSHGDFVYEVTSNKPLTDYALNYEIDGAWEAAVEVCRGDEERAEAIMDASCPSDDAEDGLELQRLRGRLAAKLGFDSVEMLDEHGTTWLCLPGCNIKEIA